MYNYLVPTTEKNKTLAQMLEEFDRNFFRPFTMESTFRTDILDMGDNYQVEAELPGFKKEDISLDVHDGILTISARHGESEEHNESDYICRERRFGSFCRSFNISEIREDAISASFRDGVLTVMLPKELPEVPASRRIEIEG